MGYLINEEYLKFMSCEEITSILSSESCPLFENIFNTYQKEDPDQFSEANFIYREIGKYLFNSIEKRLQIIIDTEEIKALNTFFNYHMLDVLSDEQINLLFNPPINLLEKTLGILNKINYKKLDIVFIGLISERVEIALGNNLGDQLLKATYKKNIKYDLLRTLNLLERIKKENVDYLNYLK